MKRLYLALVMLWVIPIASGQTDKAESSKSEIPDKEASSEEPEEEIDIYSYLAKEYQEAKTEQQTKFLDRTSKLWGPRLYPSGSFEPAMISFGNYANSFTAHIADEKYSFVNWEELGGTGTTNWKGQIHCIEFDPSFNGTSNRVMYAGSPFGGLWKSTDAGDNWHNLNTDLQLPLASVADIAINRSNGAMIFIATGNGDQSSGITISKNGSQNPVFSTGVFRTSDGGNTWEPINAGLTPFIAAGFTARRIIIDPVNPDILYLATSDGIFKSTNATKATPSWTLIFNGNLGNGADKEFKGLEMGHNSQNTLYVSGKEIYKSGNGGNTWKALTGSQAIGTGADWSLYDDNFSVERINISVTPNNVNRLYAYVIGKEDYYDGGWKRGDKMYIITSEDAGISWQVVHQDHDWRLNGLGEDGGKNYTHHRMACVADAYDENIFYYGHTWVRKIDLKANPKVSHVSPQTSQTSGFHMDIHALEINNNTNTVLWCGNDGGVSAKDLTISSATSGWSYKSTNLNVSKIWAFDDSKSNTDLIVAGYQDAGTTVSYDRGQSWADLDYGDGFGVVLDDWNTNNLIYRSNTSTRSMDISAPGSINGESNRMPYDGIGLINGVPSSLSCSDYNDVKVQRVVDFPGHNHPVTGELYVGFSEVAKRLKPLSDGQDECDPVLLWETSSNMGTIIPKVDRWRRQINNFIISKVNSKNIYVLAGGGTINGSITTVGVNIKPVLYTSTSGFCTSHPCNNFVNQASHLPNQGTASGTSSSSYVSHVGDGTFVTAASDIAVDESNGNLWMTFFGYEEGFKVWASPDGGQSWTNMDPNHSLPNLPITCILYDDLSNSFLIGTDVGVYIYNKTNQVWEKYGDFPNVRITGMQINYSLQKLRVSTYGRGMWEGELPCPVKHTSNTITVTSLYQKIQGQFITITDDYLIKAGARLTISGSNLRMAPGVKFIVEPKGELIILNSTLTNACGANKQQWGGIQVMGNPSQPMPSTIDYTSPNFNTNKQGYLYVKSSVISNAHEAFQNHRQYDWGIDLSTVGGIIFAVDSDFKNNWRTAEFSKYTADDYLSAFTNCKFITHAGYGPMRVGDNGKALAINTYISLWGVDGVNFFGCEFDNYHPNVDPEMKGIGITSIDASYTVTECTFKHLNFGVENTATSAIGSRIFVKKSIFDNNLMGIYDVGSSFSKFNENEFIIPESTKLLTNGYPIANGEEGYRWGIFTLGSTDFEMNDNFFSSTRTAISKTGTFGAIIRSSDPGGGKVLRNTFTNISMPSQMENYNLSLQLSCNTYSNYDQAWTVTKFPSDVWPPPAPTQILADQGTGCGSNKTQPNNAFMDDCLATGAKTIVSSTPFSYSANSSIAAYITSMSCVPTIVTTTLCVPVTYDCSKPSGSSGGSNKTSYFTVQKDTELISVFENESDNWEKVDLNFLKSVAIAYFKNGNLKNGEEVLEIIESKDDSPETQTFTEYYSLMNNLRSSKREIKDLNPAEILKMEAIANTKTPTAYFAENALSLVGKKVLHHNPISSTKDHSKIPVNRGEDDKGALGDALPNPAFDHVSIPYTVLVDEGDVKIILHNTSGYQLDMVVGEKGESEVHLDVSHLSAGIYFYSLVVNDIMLDTKKLVVVK